MRAARLKFTRPSFTIFLLAVLIFSATSLPAQQKSAVAAGDLSGAVSADPILKAMRDELDRSKSQLKMDNVSAP